ncbi:MAG TPA: cyclic nucleotide-binding domain-containing protein [Pyrinomonadaceae bacterium]|nr:cyclic nucleotide-binding domain-containing protein [Pyrinomonadaceae bacterium]
MPKEIRKHQTVLEAIRSVDIISDLLEKHDGHFRHELDLEVIAYGRNYQGKKVGPYIHLYEFDSGEEVIREGDWGGNTFYITVEGNLDVFVRDRETGADRKVAAIPPGVSFGEMSILAGVPRNATVRVPEGMKARVLEVSRPALRLLRKLPKFGQMLDATYRKHGLSRTLIDIGQAAGEEFPPSVLDKLGKSARFMVYAKHHVLFREGDTIDRVFFVKNGWVRRVRGLGYGGAVGELTVEGLTEDVGIDFLGAGNCLGLEGVERDAKWAYTAVVLQRTEVLEVAMPPLRSDPELRATLLRAFADFSLADDDVTVTSRLNKQLVAATEREIATGVVDGTNLLVMDMDKCVRCGNCSMACHQVHGQSRLLRRGIHIGRPKNYGGVSGEKILVPSVCMHCQDPECLTGCPTGAIGRFANGQIDIDPKTCIGCGDCATQCPYNAITMIPSRAEVPKPPTFSGRLRGWLSLAPPTPPQPVTATDNLLATKCNLCAGTSLNPPGARREAFSCQENCPTGALVRVNPREYFAEVNGRIGLVFRDQTHAIGRNIHRRDPVATLWHVFGVLMVLGLTGAIVWALERFGIDARLAGTWLTVRWITGIVGLVGIAAVMTYPLRRQVYRRRAGALRYWMLMHVYVGVAAGLVLLLHGGRTTGGLLTSLLMVSFDAVIVTGIFGTLVYLVAPRIMTSIEGEPLLVEDLRARREELRETLAEIGQRSSEHLREFIKKKVRGRVFSFGYLVRQYLRREELTALLAAARETYEEQARSLDPESRQLLLEAVEATVTLRRVDSLIYLHQLLKLWLAPHVVATSLMLALMLVHIVQVILFAVR